MGPRLAAAVAAGAALLLGCIWGASAVLGGGDGAGFEGEAQAAFKSRMKSCGAVRGLGLDLGGIESHGTFDDQGIKVARISAPLNTRMAGELAVVADFEVANVGGEWTVVALQDDVQAAMFDLASVETGPPCLGA